MASKLDPDLGSELAGGCLYEKVHVTRYLSATYSCEWGILLTRQVTDPCHMHNLYILT